MNKLRWIVSPVKKKEKVFRVHVPEIVECKRINSIAVHSQ